MHWPVQKLSMPASKCVGSGGEDRARHGMASFLQEFVQSQASFFDSYAQAGTLWAPTSDAFCYSALPQCVICAVPTDLLLRNEACCFRQLASMLDRQTQRTMQHVCPASVTFMFALYSGAILCTVSVVGEDNHVGSDFGIYVQPVPAPVLPCTEGDGNGTGSRSADNEGDIVLRPPPSTRIASGRSASWSPR